MIDQPWHKKIAEIKIDSTEKNIDWQTLTFNVEKITGVHALWLQFFGEGNEMFEVDWIRFNK